MGGDLQGLDNLTAVFGRASAVLAALQLPQGWPSSQLLEPQAWAGVLAQLSMPSAALMAMDLESVDLL